MKKIAVISMGVKLNGEKGYTRFRFLCDFLSKHGYKVDLITTSFQHWEKRHRELEKINRAEYNFGLRFIDEPGYKKNIDVQRIYSHKIAAKNLTQMLIKDNQYDLIYCEIPPNNVALAAAHFAKKKGIPFVADVNDLWPEAMRMALDIPIVSSLLFYPFRRHAEEVYRLCAGIVGTSDEYRDRPFQKRERNIPNITVYVGNEISVFDKGAEEFDKEVQKIPEEFWVTYAGTIGTSYDIRTMIFAADILRKRGYDNIHIKILGGGPLKEELEELSRTLDGRVEFIGYAPYEIMAAYLKKSNILVNSFVKKAPQSIVNKIGDYLAAGRPMINTCSSAEFRKKVEHDGFGVNIEAEDAGVLADAILSIYQNEELAEKMGQKARAVAEEQFDREYSYSKILELIQKLTN